MHVWLAARLRKACCSLPSTCPPSSHVPLAPNHKGGSADTHVSTANHTTGSQALEFVWGDVGFWLPHN